MDDPAREKKKRLSLWLAAAPGIVITLITAGAARYAGWEFGRVAEAISPGIVTGTKRLDCVEVYATTLKNSEYYVPELGSGAAKRAKYAPNEISTVLEGMARNGCGEPLSKVRILIKVRDAEGKRGSAWANVGNLPTGQAKRFERAWMGRVTEYEVAEIR